MLYLSAVFSQANLSAAIKQTERIKVCTASSFSLSSEAAQEQRTAELKLLLHAPQKYLTLIHVFTSFALKFVHCLCIFF